MPKPLARSRPLNRRYPRGSDLYQGPFIPTPISQTHPESKHGYGISRYPAEKVTPKTLFNAASMTKAFIGGAASLLVDDEEHPNVRWDTPVSELLRDDFVLVDGRYTDVVTLEDILSHRSGLPE
jgi:CubicO group peptidase (beta-lactamase class C family)